MPRKRLISPEFFLDGDLFDAEKESGLPIRLAYAGLWCQADRRGYFEWRPRELKLRVLPHDPVDMTDTMLALCRYGFLKVFEVNGKLYGAIPGFARWQTFNIRERADPYIPEPVTLLDTVPAPCKHGASTPGTGTGTGTGALTTSRRKKRDEPVTTWLTPIAEEYEKRNGPGSFNFGEAGRALKPLRAHLSPEQIARHVGFYLDQTKPEFQNLHKFAKTYAHFNPDGLAFPLEAA